MEEKKYILTDETIEFEGHTLYRIQAVKRIAPCIRPGTLGGFIESEDNLSQEGTCWIFKDSKVIDSAHVRGDAKVMTSTVRDSALIDDHAYIRMSTVEGHAKVMGFATLDTNCHIYNLAIVAGDAIVKESIIEGDALVIEHAVVTNCHICDAAIINGKARLIGPAVITSSDDFLVIGPIGSRNDYTTFYRANNNICVTCGCFKGTIDEFAEEVHRTHKGTKFEKEYETAIMMEKCKLS